MQATTEYKQFIKKNRLLYSPRTSLSKEKGKQNKMFLELTMSFDPYTISALKTEFEKHSNKMKKIDVKIENEN